MIKFYQTTTMMCFVYHLDLNPTKMAWTAIKGYVISKNVSWNTAKVIEFVKEKVATMSASVWENLCQKVKAIEADYIKSDHIVNLVSDQLIICTADDNDSEDYDDNNQNFHIED